MIKRFTFCIVSGVVTITCLFTNSVFAYSGGPPAYRTGAPGDLGTCSEDCHDTYSLNAGSAKFSITGTDVYTPGETIRLEILFEDSSKKLHGFEMTAMDATGSRIGKFKKIGKTTQVIPAGDYRALEKKDKGKYIEHTAKGAKKKRWKVKWTAPSSASGTITFYAAGNEADGDGTNTGDYIYTTTMEISDGSASE